VFVCPWAGRWDFIVVTDRDRGPGDARSCHALGFIVLSQAHHLEIVGVGSDE